MPLDISKFIFVQEEHCKVPEKEEFLLQLIDPLDLTKFEDIKDNGLYLSVYPRLYPSVNTPMFSIVRMTRDKYNPYSRLTINSFLKRKGVYESTSPHKVGCDRLFFYYYYEMGEHVVPLLILKYPDIVIPDKIDVDKYYERLRKTKGDVQEVCL